MDLAARLAEVTVLGAGGKMGSGIALLLAVEMAKRSLAPEGRGKAFRLHLVDSSPAALDALPGYIRSQALKVAEKSIVELRVLYRDRQDLVENGEIIQEFLGVVTGILRPGTELAAARASRLVFEAIVEDEGIKFQVYRKLREICPPDAYFLTNTSSVPIGLIDGEAGLGGRLIGYHFYNPPPVQKLVELIETKDTRPELKALALELGKVLRKKIVPARDVAGFIGNGHFMRDGLHALGELERLRGEGRSFVEALYMVNKVSQDFLVRPMGIFQLIDYVGIDVFQSILRVMDRHIAGAGLHSPLADRLVAAGVKGGQHAGGAQKDGFFQYGKKGPEAAWDPERGAYVPLDREGWCAKADADLGPLPEGWQPWRKLVGSPRRAESLAAHFAALSGMETLGARLAKAYHRRSRAIAEGLVREGVAASTDDVNAVLENGFYHLYGPANDYLRG